MPKKPEKFTVSTYLDDGRVFEYDVETEHRVREHAAAIVTSGYRHCEKDGTFEHFPPHRILKVKSTGMTTNYPNKIHST